MYVRPDNDYYAAVAGNSDCGVLYELKSDRHIFYQPVATVSVKYVL